MDICEYLQRIHYQGSLEPTFQTLQALHEAHMFAVPFENLSIHYGQPIVLQEPLLFDKIVRKHRGGFCYELNGLFAWLLTQLGFHVTLLAAGVAGEDGTFSPPYDHLTLLVHDVSGSDWLADVGFGDSFLRPLRFEVDVEQEGGDGNLYRLPKKYDEQTQSDYWIMQQFSDTVWQPQYRFTLRPHLLADFTERCIYQQTSPESHFTQKRICSLATPDGRITLSDLRLITTVHSEREEWELAGEDEYLRVLADQFGVVV